MQGSALWSSNSNSCVRAVQKPAEGTVILLSALCCCANASECQSVQSRWQIAKAVQVPEAHQKLLLVSQQSLIEHYQEDFHCHAGI